MLGAFWGAEFCFFYPKQSKSRQNPTSWVFPQPYTQLDTKSRLNEVTQVTFQQEKIKTEDLSKMRKPRVPISLFSYLYNQTILPQKSITSLPLTHRPSFPSCRHPFLRRLGEMARGHLQNPRQKLKLDLFSNARERW
jgi:hypothetical protein